MKYRHSFNINLKNKVLVLNYIPNSISGNKESCSILLTAHRIKDLHRDFDRRSKQRGKIVVFRETVDTSNPVPTHIIVEGAPSWREKRKARADRAENNWISGEDGVVIIVERKETSTWRVVWNREQQIERSQGIRMRRKMNWNEDRERERISWLFENAHLPFHLPFDGVIVHNRTRLILLYNSRSEDDSFVRHTPLSTRRKL